MEKVTQRVLKSLVHSGIATDITNYTASDMYALMARTNLYKIAYASGVYGLNGLLLQDTLTGEMYVITHRSTALSCL